MLAKLDWMVISIFSLVYLTYGLWVFLVVRDVVRTRKEVSVRISSAWILAALLLPFGAVIWVLYRRYLLRREAAASSG